MGQVAVKLGNRTYQLRCGDGEEPRLTELAAYVTAKVDHLRATFGQVGEDRLILMAAVLIADELFDARSTDAEALPAAESATSPA